MAKVKCSKCGKTKFVNPKAYEARLKKYGSLEAIEAQWACRECVNGSAVEKGESTSAERRKKVQQKVNRVIAESIPEYQEPSVQVEETPVE